MSICLCPHFSLCVSMCVCLYVFLYVCIDGGRGVAAAAADGDAICEDDVVTRVQVMKMTSIISMMTKAEMTRALMMLGGAAWCGAETALGRLRLRRWAGFLLPLLCSCRSLVTHQHTSAKRISHRVFSPNPCYVMHSQRLTLSLYVCIDVYMSDFVGMCSYLRACVCFFKFVFVICVFVSVS